MFDAGRFAYVVLARLQMIPSFLDGGPQRSPSFPVGPALASLRNAAVGVAADDDGVEIIVLERVLVFQSL